jgi:hypothetical protein
MVHLAVDINHSADVIMLGLMWNAGKETDMPPEKQKHS